MEKRCLPPQGYYKSLDTTVLSWSRIWDQKPHVLALFEAEQIVAKKICNEKPLFMVKWQGYCWSQKTWEPKTHLPPHLIEALDVIAHPTFLETLISKYDIGPVKLPGLSRNSPAQFLERPSNLTGPKSYFDIKVSRKVGCVLTSSEAHFVSLLDNFTLLFSKLVKLSFLMQRKQLKGPVNYREPRETGPCRSFTTLALHRTWSVPSTLMGTDAVSYSWPSACCYQSLLRFTTKARRCPHQLKVFALSSESSTWRHPLRWPATQDKKKAFLKATKIKWLPTINRPALPHQMHKGQWSRHYFLVRPPI